MTESIEKALSRRLPEAERLLSDLIAIPSLSGQEEPAIRRMAASFEGLGVHIELRAIPEGLRDDPDYAGLELDPDYAGRHNLVLTRPGRGEGRSVILQTHLDVVPADEWPTAFTPQSQDGVIFGRGACDCKGQAATLWLALAALEDAGIRLCGDVRAQLVIEEEIGGNGALATILDGDRADAAVILEPTDMNIHPACRGAIWFRIKVEGRSVHMGRKEEGVNAIEMAMVLIQALEKYEKRLIEESRGVPLFERYEHPVQVNVGMIRAGEWPSMVPGECVVDGGVGFLPNKQMRQIQEDLRALIRESNDPWIRDHATIEFPRLRNDAYSSDPNHPAVQALSAACREAGMPGEVFGWNVSCDSRLYALRGQMPAIVFGPGHVQHAHSNNEHIRMSDMAKAAEILAKFLMDWCQAG